MALFGSAFERTLAHEGGYSNHPLDRGGETYMGITRRDHPDWRGWDLLAERADAGTLRAAVAELYKARYWDRFDGDSLPAQEIADELFDTAVNMGVGRAVRFLQGALNALNKRGMLWPDLVVDGDLGPRTREALDACLLRHDETHLLRVLNVLQGMFYLQLAERDESQEVFLRGWLRRVFPAAATA